MIRKIEMRDFPFMQEWMKDEEVTKNLQANFASFTKEQIEGFINKANTQNFESEDLHYAIVDENDEYMGTISLKSINHTAKNAEYAIATRKIAHGKGYARYATEDILKVAFETLKLEKVYLYVDVDNIAANKFYCKCGFKEEGVFRKHLIIGEKLKDIRWYAVLKDEYQLAEGE